MTTRPRTGVAQMLLAAALLSLSNCSSEHACTPVGCQSGATLNIMYMSPPAGLVGGTVTVCRNAECYSGIVPALPGTNDVGANVAFANAPPVGGTLSHDQSGMVHLDFEWRLDSQPPASDHYVVTLAETTGATLTMFDKIVYYIKVVDMCGGPPCWRGPF